MKTSPRRAVVYALLGVGLGLLLGWQALHRRDAADAPGGNRAAQTVDVSSSRRAEELLAQSPSSTVAPPELAEKRVAANETTEQLIAEIEAALAAGGVTDWERVLNVLFPALLVKDRRAAAQFVDKLDAGERRDLLLRRVARAWAAADFSDAVTWITSLPNADDRKIAFEDACIQVAESDPAEAIQTWQALEYTADDHVLENLAQKWATKDVDAARAWVESKPSSKFRDQAVARIGYVLAQQKPVDALVFVTRELPKGPAQTEAVMSVLQQWGQRDLLAAKGWAQQLPEGDLAARARDELAGIAQRSGSESKSL